VGGRLYVYDWSGRTWTEPVTTANLTTAGITLSTTATCYAVTFADKLVVSDGVNTMWTWDGTSGAGGLTKLTGSPIAYGQPVVYYSKLFVICAADRKTIMWSEEADATLGFEIGNYKNSWTFGQTGTSPLEALAATNAALTIIRQRGITQIRGAVNDQFSATGVQDAISQQVGTLSPASVLIWDQSVYFLGSDRHFYRIAVDGFSQVGHGHRTTLETLPQNKLPQVQAQLWWGAPNQRFLVYGFVETAGSYLTRYLVLKADDGATAGTWSGWACDRLGDALDADGLPRLCWLGGDAALTSSEGYAYALGSLDGLIWSDGFVAATAPVRHSLTSGFVGWDEQIDKQWTRLDLTVLLPSDLTGVTVTTTTNRRSGSALTLPVITGAGGGLWDVMNWDQENWGGSEEVEQKASVGLNNLGRWCQVTIGHDTLNEQFVFQSARLTGLLRDADPRSR
jgi:hypothetical protein